MARISRLQPENAVDAIKSLLPICEQIVAETKDQFGDNMRRCMEQRAGAPTNDDAATKALDSIAGLCGVERWEYPGQVVRDVEIALGREAIRNSGMPVGEQPKQPKRPPPLSPGKSYDFWCPVCRAVVAPHARRDSDLVDDCSHHNGLWHCITSMPGGRGEWIWSHSLSD